jgi:rhamnogalacturonyl hydrolase YesR
VPETSGTALFCEALAWGVRRGHLDRGPYRPVVEGAWRGLCAAVDGEGRLLHVQPPAYEPTPGPYRNELARRDGETVYLENAYGAGAFLLAGREVAGLVAGSKEE